MIHVLRSIARTIVFGKPKRERHAEAKRRTTAALTRIVAARSSPPRATHEALERAELLFAGSVSDEKPLSQSEISREKLDKAGL